MKKTAACRASPWPETPRTTWTPTRISLRTPAAREWSTCQSFPRVSLMLRGSFWTVTINTVKKVSATGFCINLNLLFLEQIWGPNQKAKCWKFYTFPIITSDKWTQGAGWGRSSWLLLHQSNPKHRGQSGVPGVSGQSQRRGENLVYLMMPQRTHSIYIPRFTSVTRATSCVPGAGADCSRAQSAGMIPPHPLIDFSKY